MRFKQFLKEIDSSKSNLQEIANLISEKCREYLLSPDVDIEFLRGAAINSPSSMKIGVSENAFIGKVRKNRKSESTPKWLHDLIDDFLKEKFNIAGRSEALFVVQDEKIARNYVHSNSALYRIFPIGNYETIWSPYINDLYFVYDALDSEPAFVPLFLEAARELYPDYDGESILSSVVNGEPDISFSDVMKRVIEENGDKLYVKNNLNKITNLETEIMLVCDQYIAVKYEIVEDVLHLLYKDL